MELYSRITCLIKDEIKKSVVELDSKYGLKNLHGIALGTDDDVSTLYHVVCTHEWVAKQKLEQEYAGIGYIFVEWTESADDSLFLSISDLLRQEAEKESTRWDEDRDNRFHAIGRALAEVREEEIFSTDTFLCVGSTDPSDHMEQLGFRWIKMLNTHNNVKRYEAAMGYSSAS